MVTAAGIGFVLARTTIGGRTLERAIKNAGGARRYCPICCPHPRNGKWAPAPSATPEAAMPEVGVPGVEL